MANRADSWSLTVGQRKGTRLVRETKPQVRRGLTCGYGGGQGRGRTADLPIFSRTFEEVDTDLLALLTADCCPRATYLVTVVKSRA